MSNPLWFSASAQSLIDDQIKRKTNATVVAYQQQPLDGNAHMQSPSIGDANVWQAHETLRDTLQDRTGTVARSAEREIHFYTILWGRLRCRLSAMIARARPATAAVMPDCR